MFEFLGLKLVGLSIVVCLLVYLYRKYKDQTTIDDVLISKFKELTGKAEKIVADKANELQKTIAQEKIVQDAKARLEAEVQKAKDFAEKVKGLFN